MGVGSAAEAAGRDLHRHLPGHLRRHAHRVRRSRLQHRPRVDLVGDRRRADQPQPRRACDERGASASCVRSTTRRSRSSSACWRFSLWVAGPVVRSAPFERRAWLLVATGAGLGVLVGRAGHPARRGRGGGPLGVGIAALARDLDRARQPLRLGLGRGGRCCSRSRSSCSRCRGAGGGSRWAWLGLVAVYLVISPALAGHASIAVAGLGVLPVGRAARRSQRASGSAASP